jgi:aspartyl/asparaginyl beta-hydroxylase (cupin superfamily)
MRNLHPSIFTAAAVVTSIIHSHIRVTEAFFQLSLPNLAKPSTLSSAAKGFGASSTAGSGKKKIPKKKAKKEKQPSNARPFVRSEQDKLIEQLAAKSSKTCIGQVVAEAQQNHLGPGESIDPFWELLPSLISSRFPNVPDQAFERIAGMVRYALHPHPQELLDPKIIADPWRPHEEIHAYMPGLENTTPFWDPSQLEISQQLSDNYEIIKSEYQALLQDKKDRFQSVTSMNYDSGWKTLVLFYNGHRIPDFPYHLCPKTTELLETLPLAGRIAGFNRQAPSSGIPLHSDGNNMWLTLQMGIQVPEGEKAWIQVGPETKRWKNGECIMYDTTFEHKTMNEHESQERVVLHIDFFNMLGMTPVEIEAMRYIYSLREEFMKAEGVSKVGKQIL